MFGGGEEVSHEYCTGNRECPYCKASGPFFTGQDFKTVFNPPMGDDDLDFIADRANERLSKMTTELQAIKEQAKSDVAQLAAMCNEVVRLREEKANWRAFAENQANNWEASAEIVKKQNERIKDLELRLSRFRLWGTDVCPTCQSGRVTLYALYPQECISCSGAGDVKEQ